MMHGDQRAALPLHLCGNLRVAGAFARIFLSEKQKEERKIILDFSMMKMDRTPPALTFLVLSLQNCNKSFIIALYYISCNSLQVFLMKEQ